MIISQVELNQALKACEKFRDTGKTAIKALQGVLYKDGTLTAYNLENSIQVKIEVNCSILESEQFIIPKNLIDFIAKSDSDSEIIITADNETNQLTVNAGKSKTTLSSLNPIEFPNIPISTEDLQNIKIDKNELAETISSVLYAVSTNDNNQILTGILLKLIANKLDIVACDGMRLSKGTIEVLQDEIADFDVIIPNTSFNGILPNISKFNTNTVIFSYNNNFAFLTSEDGSIKITTRLLSGTFIDYLSVIPKCDYDFTINRNEFIKIIELCTLSVLANQNEKTPIRIDITEQKQLTITAKTAIGQYSGTIPIESERLKDLNIAFNSKYLFECLKNLKDENVTVYFMENLTPWVINSSDLTSIVLPVRIKD